MDQVDAAPFPGRPTNEPVLEGTYAAGFYMYAGIGGMEVVVNVGPLTPLRGNECEG